MEITEIPLDNDNSAVAAPLLLEKSEESAGNENDIPETPKQSELIQEESKEKPTEIQESVEPLTKTKAKRGRPPGSRNKAPAKPRKVKIVEESIDVVTPPKAKRDYEPSSPKTIMHTEGVNDTCNELAVQVLRLLQNQAGDRQRKKRVQYASWFQ